MKKTKSITLKLSDLEFRAIEKWANFSFANLTGFCKSAIAERIRELEERHPSPEERHTDERGLYKN